MGDHADNLLALRIRVAHTEHALATANETLRESARALRDLSDGAPAVQVELARDRLINALNGHAVACAELEDAREQVAKAEGQGGDAGR